MWTPLLSKIQPFETYLIASISPPIMLEPFSVEKFKKKIGRPGVFYLIIKLTKGLLYKQALCETCEPYLSYEIEGIKMQMTGSFATRFF